MSSRDLNRRLPRQRQYLRRLVEAGVLLGIAGAMASEFLVEGWLAPIVVSSGSMATTLLGPHRMAHCPDCGMEFACDAEGAPEGNTAACPNCGRGGIELDPQVIAGDRLLIDRGTYFLRQPRRWEVALFRCPEHAGDYCVKRVVGLPGESIEIRGGEVYVDGAIVRKSLAEQRELAMLVHDTDWSPGPSNLPNRWSPQSDGGWQMVETGWQCKSGSPSVGWLNYVHWRRAAGSLPTVEESPVLDEDGYNQATTRQLNVATNLLLVCQLSARGKGTLLLKAHDGREEFRVSIEPATGQIALARNGKIVQTVQAAAGLLEQRTDLVLSLVDQQIVLAVGGREKLIYPYDPTAKAVHARSQPFSIGDVGLDVQIIRLQIWRDIYYTSSIRTGSSSALHLGPDEYFVIGDNSPISRDSRPWTGGEVLRGSLLVGHPLYVFRRQ